MAQTRRKQARVTTWMRWGGGEVGRQRAERIQTKYRKYTGTGGRDTGITGVT